VKRRLPGSCFHTPAIRSVIDNIDLRFGTALADTKTCNVANQAADVADLLAS